MAVASCLAFAGAAFDASAAGLGKIVVLSSLGQPLRAEIELTASREELSDMRAQLASPDAFKQAGIDLAPALAGIRFAVDKRQNGQSVIRLSSDRPINDPFVDMLLELNWATGRLVREYTFLLDPPDMTAKASASSVVQPAARPLAPASPRPVSSIGDDVRARAEAAKDRPAAPPVSASSTDVALAPAETREVRRGDTLRKIANETKPDGVSLEQMLVGLMRSNRDAFDGGNMNRLRAGRILTIPDKAVVETVAPGEAKKIVAAQSSDWHAYRGKMAALAAQAPVKEDSASQESGGRITAKVEDKAAAAVDSKDQLKVSRTESGTAKPGAAPARGEEDSVAKDKALKEANERSASLEKNVADLQKLLEMKNQSLAELQKQASAKPEVAAAQAVEVKKPVESQKTADSGKTAEAVKASEVPKPVDSQPPVAAQKTAEPAKPADVAKPVEATPVAEAAKPAEPPKPVDVPKPAEPVKPSEPPKPKVAPPPPPPPPPEPSFFDDLLANPMTLLGGGGVLALLGALLVAKRRRAAKPEEAPIDLNSTLTPTAAASLTSNSVFRSTGGQSVDTSHTPVQTDFSQAGPGSIDMDEVDPVAEADVYMAYGRDVQAEEILLEAKQKDPKRHAIHLKLLEIYANRKDLARFETLATELYSETGGVGADWEKALVMGHKLDPANPLFGGPGKTAAPLPFDADATVVVAGLAGRNTVTLPGELSQMAEGNGSGGASPVSSAPSSENEANAAAVDLSSLDFDLGFADEKKPVSADEAPKAVVAPPADPAVEMNALDFDLGGGSPQGAATAGLAFERPEPVSAIESNPKPAVVADLDFDLGFDTPPAVPAPVQPIGLSNDLAAQEDGGVEFDVSLTESTFLGRSVPGANSFNISAIDLDLDTASSGDSASALAPLGASVSPSDKSRTPFSSPMAPPEPQPSDALPAFEHAQTSTAVNPDFSTEQMETLVNPSFDGGAGAKFEAEQAVTMLAPNFGAETELVPSLEISSNEEVTTKLDLAKAYEEMGDLEGARELLQEVVQEGDVAQREKAGALLARMGQ